MAEKIASWVRGDDIDDSDGGSISVSGDSALKYNAMWTCCRILGEAFASVPIFEYRKINDNTRIKTNATGVYDVLHNRANDDMSAYNLKEMAAYQINIGGNFVAKRQYSYGRDLLALHPFRHSEVSFAREKASPNRLVYQINPSDGSRERQYYRKDIFHVPGPSLDGIIGMSPVAYASNAIRLGLTWEKLGNNLFKNGVFPTGVFQHPGILKDEAFKRLKCQLSENWAGSGNMGKPIVAEDGLEFTPLKIDLGGIQMVDLRRLSAQDIYGVYRIQPHMASDLTKATNNNIEHLSLEFVMYTMLPWFKRWEECVNCQLLSRENRDDGYYFEFNMASLLRGDQKSMAESFAIGRQWGWLSVNDIRKLLNLNAVEGGDIYLQPLNMVKAGYEPEDKEKISNRVIDEVLSLIESRGKK